MLNNKFFAWFGLDFLDFPRLSGRIFLIRSLSVFSLVGHCYVLALSSGHDKLIFNLNFYFKSILDVEQISNFHKRLWATSLGVYALLCISNVDVPLYFLLRLQYFRILEMAAQNADEVKYLNQIREILTSGKVSYYFIFNWPFFP